MLNTFFRSSVIILETIIRVRAKFYSRLCCLCDF